MSKTKQRLIFLITYLAYTSIYVARVNLSMAGPELIDTNILNTVQLGILGSVFSTVYAVGRLFNGQISDKTPPYIMLTTGLSLAGVANILLGFFPPFVGIFLLWTTNAYAQSMLWSSVLCVVSSIYDEKTAKQKTPVMVTSVALGNILGIIINTILITKISVKFAFVVPGILTLILGVFVLIATRKIKPEVKVKTDHISIFSLLKNREILMMLVPAMLHGAMKDNITLWMTVFIIDTFAVDFSQSSYYVLLIPIVGFIGRIIYPPLYKLCKKNESIVSIFAFILCTVSSFVLIFKEIGALFAVILLSIIYASVSVINTSILSIYPLYYIDSGNVASVGGLMDFATYLGAGIASFIYGLIIKNFGYTPMFLSWTVISVISIVVVYLINKMREREAKA